MVDARISRDEWLSVLKRLSDLEHGRIEDLLSVADRLDRLNKLEGK